MDYVPAFDAVHRAAGGVNDRGEWDMTNNPNGYDPVSSRFSVGKVQPLAGLSVATVTPGKGTTGGYNVYNGNTMYAQASSLTASMVRDQTAAPMLPMTPTNPNEPKNTFGRHNGHAATAPTAATVNATATPPTLTDTIMLPFDWQPHLDRPLVSTGDLFTLRDCPPHRLTTEFVQPTIIPPATTQSLYYEKSYAQWSLHNNGLTRALELLTVKSPDLRVAHGGRVGGRVNLNVVQDSRIVQGVWDAPAAVTTGNRFDQTFVTNNVWNGLMASRSSPMQTKRQADGTTTFTSPVPTSSVLDVPNGFTVGGTDRPIMPFGAPTAAAGGFAYANPNIASDGSSDGDTILRRNLTATPSVPYLYQTSETNPYTRTEPLRKVLNNISTTSNTFAVYLTIGYFEVNTPTTAPAGWPANVPVPPQFGVEVFDQIPGDMRQKFVAVVDMSNMALKANPPANDTDPHATVRPFFTALAATARPPATAADPVTLTLASGGGNGTTFSIPTDGQTASVIVGDDLILGYGLEAQRVRVQSVGTAGPTVNQITVTGLTRTAWGGTCVSNVRPGYAGPRADFDFNAAKYKPVVPYVERLK